MYVISQRLKTGSFYDVYQSMESFTAHWCVVGPKTYSKDVVGYVSEGRNNVNIKCDLHGYEQCLLAVEQEKMCVGIMLGLP